MYEPRRWVCTLRPASAGGRDRIRPRRAAAGSRRARQEGVALVTVLILAAVLVSLSVIASRDAITELRISRNDQLAKDAIAVAEAGLYHAFDLVKHNAIDLNACLSNGGTGGALATVGSTATLDGASYRFAALGNISGGGYYVRAVDNSDETAGANDPTRDVDGSIWLVSRGRVGGAERRIDVLLTARAGGLPGGIFGKGSVTFGGNGGYIDSFDSAQGPYTAAGAGSQAAVGSNGAILLQSDVVDHGDATAGTTVSCSTSPCVTGTTTQYAPTVTLNPDPAPNCTTYTDGTGITGGTYYGATGKKAGQLVGGSGDNIVFTSGTYCFSTVNVSGGGLVTANATNGPVIIKINGVSSFGGGGVVNTTALASNLEIISSYTGVKGGLTINGGSQAYAQVYAPDTEVVLGGGTDFYGSLVAGSLSSTGGSKVHSDVALGSANGAAVVTLSAWHEVRN